MTKLIAILIALTCATLHAQSVTVKGTGAGDVRGAVVVTTNVTSVLTNLLVTGASLNPPVSGTYTPITDLNGYPAWESTNGYYDYWASGGSDWRIASTTNSDAQFYRIATVTGEYAAFNFQTGTPVVVYSRQTNYSSAVTVQGKGTP